MMNVNELKAYIEGLLAAESDTVPRDAVVRIREMVEKLPTSTVTTTMMGGAVGWIDGKPVNLTGAVWKDGKSVTYPSGAGGG